MQAPLPLAVASSRKERGAFFTPPELARFLAEWAIQSSGDRVLEPSSGEAGFLIAAGERLKELGSTLDSSQVRGVEIHAESAAVAKALLQRHGYDFDVRAGDFLECPSEPLFDAVIGNPPYVRYQQFSGSARSKGKEVALAQGVQLPGLASSWAAFVVHAASFLTPTGRLALVLPAELLSVNYAAPVRSYLMRRFASVKLILFESRVFPGVLEEVVLLLATGEGPTDHCELFQAKDISDLNSFKPQPWSPPRSEDKWIAGLLPTKSLAVYTETAAKRVVTPLLTWGETDLGMVTGNNKYFALDSSAVMVLGLREDELLKISPPSSKHLHGLTFSEVAWREMIRDGARGYLFYPKSKEMSNAALNYIKQGEREGVNAAYKCRMRSPWWQVPTVGTPDLFLTYMNHGAPRLVANGARVKCLNSTHGVTLHKDHKKNADLLPVAFLNSMTQLSAELVGRSYGGGMLKLEPREADKLLVPSPELIEEHAQELAAVKPQLGRLLRGGKTDEAVKAVDRIVLTKGAKLKYEQIDALRTSRALLFSRRIARSSGQA